MTAYVLRDSNTMLRRNLRRMARYPSIAISTVLLPITFLLLFAYVFGDTLGAGLVSAGDRGDYINFMTPGILLLAVVGSMQSTTIAVSMDMNEGIIARFRTMAIARSSVLNGHVIGSLIQAMGGLVIVIGFALLVGFRSSATPIEWLAALGLLALLALALTWLSAAFGLFAKTVEGASNLPLPIFLLPFLGSGFVPADSMPSGLSWFAQYQPFTPITDTLRGLLLGLPIGNSAYYAIAWCVALVAVGYLWANRLYARDPVPRAV